MRRIAVIFILMTIVYMLVSPCLADNKNSERDIMIYVDGERVESEKKPIIEESRTLVPIRAVAEKARIKVSWDAEEYKVRLKYSFTEVTLTVGSDVMTVYNSIIDSMTKKTLDTVPKIIDGSTYITLRAALEELGAGVLWDGERRAVYVVSPDSMVNALLNTQLLEKNLENYRKYIDKKYGAPEENGTEENPDEEVTEESENNDTENSDVETSEESDNNTENFGEQPEASENNGEEKPNEEVTEEPTPDNVETSEADTPVKSAKDYGITFTGFRKMQDGGIKENEIFLLSGKVRSQTPLVLVKCVVPGTDIDEAVEYSAKDGKTVCDIYSVFGKKVKLNKAGVGEHTFKIMAKCEDGELVEVFSLDYKVSPKSEGHISPNPDGDDKSDEGDEDESFISYYGFRTMQNNRITEGAPHGLYGTISSAKPIVKVRCLIEGTDMDYVVNLSARNEICEYNVFTYFDKLIRFSDAGLGKKTFKIYAAAESEEMVLLFSYTYTVTKKGSDNGNNSEKNDREAVDITNPYMPDNVCLPLKGNIRLTSPYGFRAYNKWEFHKGIDIISDSSLDIVCVADGIVVDCATGKNSGAGNYVAIQHDEGWVSLYYHLKSYDVEIGDRVKMGDVIAIMGNTGGNYGVHLHFMTCDDWYGGIWATQNNHHTAPHEYVPQILTAVKNYNPNFESQNKDKIILCNFNFPDKIKAGTAYSISKAGGFAATEKGVAALSVIVTDADGTAVINETEENPESTTDGYYTYTEISVGLDMKCLFDKLDAGKYVFSVVGETIGGRKRVIYTKAFEVVDGDDE